MSSIYAGDSSSIQRGWRHYKKLYQETVFLRFFFIYLFIYLFIHERHTEEAETQAEGEAGSSAGSLMWDSIPGPWDHDLSRRQMLNHWATPRSLSRNSSEFGKHALAIQSPHGSMSPGFLGTYFHSKEENNASAVHIHIVSGKDPCEWALFQAYPYE